MSYKNEMRGLTDELNLPPVLLTWSSVSSTVSQDMDRLFATAILLGAILAHGATLDAFNSTCNQITGTVSSASTVSWPCVYIS